MTENQFNSAFHNKEAFKYNILHKICIILIYIMPIIFIIFYKMWMIPIFIGLELFLYLLGVKMLSLRDINIYASICFKNLHEKELRELFR